jgi:hypothetical protein
MQTFLQDIRYGLRGLWKRPGFTAVALITLALGIGANAAIFSVVNAVLLKPLQFRDAERLVIVWEDASFVGFPRNTPAPANYVDWKNQAQSFEDISRLKIWLRRTSRVSTSLATVNRSECRLVASLTIFSIYWACNR